MLTLSYCSQCSYSVDRLLSFAKLRWCGVCWFNPCYRERLYFAAEANATAICVRHDFPLQSLRPYRRPPSRISAMRVTVGDGLLWFEQISIQIGVLFVCATEIQRKYDFLWLSFRLWFVPFAFLSFALCHQSIVVGVRHCDDDASHALRNISIERFYLTIDNRTTRAPKIYTKWTSTMT